MNFKKIRYGEAFLWISFVLLAVLSLADGPENGVAVAGLFALAAIGLRATRAVEVATSSKVDGE